MKCKAPLINDFDKKEDYAKFLVYMKLRTPWTVCRIKFVNMVGSTLFLRDTYSIFASSVFITEADLPGRRSIFSH